MGGDHGPSEVVPGALDFARSHPRDTLILVGDEAVVRSIAGDLPANVRIVRASEVVGMDEHPALALREKKDSPAWRLRSCGWGGCPAWIVRPSPSR
jgi:glycerol-3-phosphate acyltransferase PlsX